MSATNAKGVKKGRNGAIAAGDSDAKGDVLTLSEAAAYLRVEEKQMLNLVAHGDIPGRRIGNEWRFLKSGLHEWLGRAARQPGKEALLALVGVWKDDPDIDQIVREAHRRRGRSMPEPGA
jgi:excisionase family DNA binding protein